MKKIRISFLLLIILVTYLGISCSSTKETVVIPQIAPSQTEVEMTVWVQSYYENFAVGDPIDFYVSSEVTLEGDLLNHELFLNGVLNRTDNIKEVIKIIETNTPGTVVDMKKDANGIIIDMFVSFSRNDETYKLNFKRSHNDPSFRLNGNAKLIFEGNEYPVLATIKGDECKLLFGLRITKNIEKINEKAEGNESVGVKIVTSP